MKWFRSRYGKATAREAGAQPLQRYRKSVEMWKSSYSRLIENLAPIHPCCVFGEGNKHLGILHVPEGNRGLNAENVSPYQAVSSPSLGW